MQETIRFDVTLDCRNIQCPMPILKARGAVKELQPGQVLEVLATDPGSVPDFQAFAVEIGVDLLAQQLDGNVYKHYLRKGH